MNGQMSQGPKRLLLIGEPVLDITERVQEARFVRTVARHAAAPFNHIHEPRSTLGGVFFLGRFFGYFYGVDIAYTRPEAFDNTRFPDLLEDLQRQDDYRLYPSPAEQSLFWVRRTIQCCFSGSLDFSDARTLLRVESKLPSQLKPEDRKRFLDWIESLAQKDVEYSAVILADYDLGLFSPEFIEPLSEILWGNRFSETPIIAYTGRTCRKFNLLPGCFIVSNLDEAVGDLPKPEDTTPDNPIEFVAKHLSRLSGAVLVTGRNIRAGSWRQVTPHEVEGTAFSFSTKDEASEVPMGYRAMLAAWLALGMAHGRNLKQSLADVESVTSKGLQNLLDEIRHLTDTVKQLRDSLDEPPSSLDTPSPGKKFRTTCADTDVASQAAPDEPVHPEIIKVMICYAHEQEEAEKKLQQHLENLATRYSMRVDSWEAPLWRLSLA